VPTGLLGEVLGLPEIASFFAYWHTPERVSIPMANYHEELPHLFAILAKPRTVAAISRSIKLRTCASLLLIVRQLVYEQLPFDPHIDRRRLIARFRELVELHFREHTDLHFYAETLGTSEQYLGELCRDKLGRGAKEIIQLRRVQEAKHLLTSTNQSIKEIAYALGFEDPNYFSRFFKRYVGVSAVAYRG
jgi:AraC-like DNA-binding protein